MLFAYALMVAPASAACPEAQSPPSLVVDTALADTSAPGTPEVLTADFQFLQGGSDGCEACPDQVEFVLTFGAAQDDQTAPEDLGYVMRLLDGELPDGITLPAEPFLGPEARFTWDVDREIAGTDQELTVELRTVDEAGNESVGSVQVKVTVPAVPAILLGCTQAPSPTGGLLVLMGAAWTRRRKGSRTPHA